MTRILITAAMLLSPLALAAGPSANDAKQVLDQIQTAFNQHDASKLANDFAPDGTLILPDGKVLHGKAAIQSQLTQMMKSEFKDTKNTFTLTGTRPIGANAMWVDATHRMDNMLKPDGSHGSVTYHLTSLLEKRGGKWLVTEARPYVYQQAPQMGTGGAGDAGR